MRAGLNLIAVTATSAAIRRPMIAYSIVLDPDAAALRPAADRVNGDGIGASTSAPDQTRRAYFAGTWSAVTLMPKSPDVLNEPSQRPFAAASPWRCACSHVSLCSETASVAEGSSAATATYSGE